MDTTVSLKLPPKNYRRIIEELSVVIPDPALKLKFLKQAIDEHQKISAPHKLYPSIAGIAYRQKLLDKAEEIWPGSKKAAKKRIHQGLISALCVRLLCIKKFRYLFGSAILTLFIFVVSMAVSPLMRSLNFGTSSNLISQKAGSSNTKIIIRKPIIYPRQYTNSNSSNSVVLDPANDQNAAGEKSWYYKNPMLRALASHRDAKSSFNQPIKKPLISSHPKGDGDYSTSSSAIPEEVQKRPKPALDLFQSPVLSALTSQQAIKSTSKPTYRKPSLSSQAPKKENRMPSHIVRPVKHPIKPVQVPQYLKNPIWLVEKPSDREIYSNRLQIITTHTISNIPREYYRFLKKSDHLPGDIKITNKISGIVYHASESDLYPFMPEMNRSILKYSKRLIRFLLRNKSYHFFIDRFGRVYRLVREEHAAFHAGNSIWADDDEIYLNLNHAFIGICFEGKDFEEINSKKQKKGRATTSRSLLLKSTGISSFNEAQLRSGKELTDWLRVKYNISQHNCVPHALTSVNPDRKLIGFHLDLARGFPYAKFGLSDKYREPLPSMVEFGFLYDSYFEKIFNGELWQGIRYSEEILQHRARKSDMSLAEYRKTLHQKYSRYMEWNKKLLEKKDKIAKRSPQK